MIPLDFFVVANLAHLKFIHMNPAAAYGLPWVEGACFLLIYIHEKIQHQVRKEIDALIHKNELRGPKVWMRAVQDGYTLAIYKK